MGGGSAGPDHDDDNDDNDYEDDHLECSVPAVSKSEPRDHRTSGLGSPHRVTWWQKNFQIIEMIINCFENYRHRYDYYGNKGGVAATRAVKILALPPAEICLVDLT